jgi:energy-coupling factor transporter ATP-binding protein EcfA2
MANFRKAVKHESKLRMSIAGPSGSGKTYTALTLAHALKGDKGVALIDTERGSASKYADVFPEFDVVELDTFSPTLFVEMIKEAESAGCYSVLVIDSLSHAWNGTGGLLEIVDAIAKRKYQNNTYVAWKDATPLQNALIDAITRSSLHIIVTMRSKQEYALEKDERTNKTTPKKIGMAPIQRDGMEYEFDIAADMDIDNTMIIQKSRCSQLAGQVIAKPNEQVADVLKAWLEGEPVPETEQRSPVVSIKDRRYAVYDRALELGQFKKGKTSGESLQAFLAFAGQVIDANITNIEQLTASRLDTIEAFLRTKDAA